MSVHVTPKPGRLVVVPELGTALPPEGCLVAWTAYWQQRQIAGDVTVEHELPQAAKEITAPPATAGAPQTSQTQTTGRADYRRKS